VLVLAAVKHANGGFCVEALSEALARFDIPGIFNTDQSLSSRKRGRAIHQQRVHHDAAGSRGHVSAMPVLQIGALPYGDPLNSQVLVHRWFSAGVVVFRPDGNFQPGL
jgi:hypothetical protein